LLPTAPGEYQRECFKQYGLKTDSSGWYAAQYKPYHLIGLELGVSVASIMVRGEPTGQTKTWTGDVVATAKRDLKAGEKLDGEGGFTVYGKLMTAKDSMAIEGLPIGLAHGFVLKRDVKKDEGLSWQDVEYSATAQAVAVRKEMEQLFKKEFEAKKVNGTNGVNGVH
jgi:predicted homoserine dehydrogenase-like protein